ncbi:MAG: type II toxin-antitoxin system RelB/DinJ family antitoxin [Clostridia bacterium]|nr:type II toxin-antitoxin system RelB/DinJ family antitoxin [Clostridia bacterium]MBR1803022.1 type II toxin-antitoxin system RelB/DinJ family antitoxin [Clostridia bacterium]
MAKTTTMNIRIEPQLKQDVEEVLNDLGMNIAEAVTIYFKQIVLTDSIPLQIKRPRFNRKTLEAINEADKIMEEPEKYKSYNDVYEMLEEIEDEQE